MKLDNWIKMYCLMRILKQDSLKATKIANIVTGECRGTPDDHEMRQSILAYLKTKKVGDCEKCPDKEDCVLLVGKELGAFKCGEEKPKPKPDTEKPDYTRN